MANSGVYITYTAPQLPSFRVPAGAPGGTGGRFTGSGNYLGSLNNQISKELQDRVADIIEAERSVREKNPRREDGKGTLARATRHPDNRVLNGNLGFGVGVKGHLAKHARYYRIIEEGSDVAAPAYTSTMISRAKTKGGREIWLPRGGGFGTQYPVPEKSDTRVANLPRRPIEPLYAYSRAWNDINASGRMKSAWRNILVGAGAVKKTGPLPKKFDLGFIDY